MKFAVVVISVVFELNWWQFGNGRQATLPRLLVFEIYETFKPACLQRITQNWNLPEMLSALLTHSK